MKGVKDMLEENRYVINEAREKMMEWNIYEFEEMPDSVRMYQELLEEFYSRNGNSPSDPFNFNARVKLSPDAEEELADLATAFLYDDTTDIDYFEDFFDPSKKEWRDRFDINTMDDLVNFLNRVERYRNDALISSILSSSQIVELFNEGDKRGLTENEITRIIYLEYNMTGNEDTKLYDQIWNSLNNYDTENESFIKGVNLWE